MEGLPCDDAFPGRAGLCWAEGGRRIDGLLREPSYRGAAGPAGRRSVPIGNVSWIPAMLARMMMRKPGADAGRLRARLWGQTLPFNDIRIDVPNPQVCEATIAHAENVNTRGTTSRSVGETGEKGLCTGTHLSISVASHHSRGAAVIVPGFAKSALALSAQVPKPLILALIHFALWTFATFAANTQCCPKPNSPLAGRTSALLSIHAQTSSS